MKFDLNRSYEILERTAAVLKTLLSNLSEEWVMENEGPETFSSFDVVGHLICGEKTDWAARTRIILEFGLSKPFEPWDRFAQYEESKGKSLQHFTWLRSLRLTENDLDKKGMHPLLGEVTLRNLLATWVVHDLTHIAQVTRVMAKQYKEEMGPWPEFFRILSF